MSDDNLTHCVSCGKRLRTSDRGARNHRCSAQFERRRAAENRRAERDGVDESTFDEKLADGFALLGNR